MQVVLSVALLGFMIFALVDVIRRDNWSIRFLTKFGWVLVIVLLPLVGSILWFVLGRPGHQPSEPVSFGDPQRDRTTVSYDAVRPDSLSTEDDEAAIEKEIAFHEKQAEIRRLEATLRSKRENGGPGELPA